MTERAVAGGPQGAATVRELADAGVPTILDDYGIGYSSLRRLVELPFAALKIDRGFIAEMGTNSRADAVVLSAIELARTLGLAVTAEGVEDIATWHRLRGYGVDAVQGYLIAKPMPADELADWLDVNGEGLVPERRTGAVRRDTARDLTLPVPFERRVEERRDLPAE